MSYEPYFHPSEMNPLPVFNVEDPTFIKAPLCVLDLETKTCIYCQNASQFGSYQSYLENLWACEYEGNPLHQPMPEDDYTLIYSLCVSHY